MQNDLSSTIRAMTFRLYDGKKAGTYLTVLECSGQFMEPEMTADSLLGHRNEAARFTSVVNDFGDLVCVKRYH